MTINPVFQQYYIILSSQDNLVSYLTGNRPVGLFTIRSVLFLGRNWGCWIDTAHFAAVQQFLRPRKRSSCPTRPSFLALLSVNNNKHHSSNDNNNQHWALPLATVLMIMPSLIAGGTAAIALEGMVPSTVILILAFFTLISLATAKTYHKANNMRLAEQQPQQQPYSTKLQEQPFTTEIGAKQRHGKQQRSRNNN